MHEERDDKQLEKYLDGNSDESRRYADLGDEVPPPEVDARILAEAERAVKVTPLDSRRAPPFKAFAWAAIVVLSFSLVLNIVFQQAAQDPIAELESMGGRFDAPSAPVELKDRDDVVAKRERPEPLATMTEGRQLSGFAAGEASRSAESPGVREEMLLGSSEHAIADALEADEDLSASRPASTAAAPMVVARLRNGEETMRIIADYLAGVAGADRITVAANVVRDREQPDAELKRILDLYDDGAEEEALAALTEFRDLHPDHPVSQALAERESR